MALSNKDLERFSPAAKRQILQQLGAQQRQKEPKYHNEQDARGKIKFDSKKEARRYDELMLMLKSGRIRNLRLQAQYTLQESYVTEIGERVRAIRYVADFAYEQAMTPDHEGNVHWYPVVEDVKSKATMTDKYKIKAKMFRERYGFAIREV